MPVIKSVIFVSLAAVAVSGCIRLDADDQRAEKDGSYVAGSSESASQTSESSRATLENGIISVSSNNTAAVTMDKLDAAVRGQGLTVFARIDHQDNARNAGMDMSPASVLIFGNPKLGTPLMQANPSVSLDLPQNMSVYENTAGEVTISYNDPIWLAARHELSGSDKVLKKISGALDMLSNKAAN